MIHSYQKQLKGKSVGVVFGSFAPLHQGHLDLIMRAKKENDGGCIVIVCGFDGDKGEPLMPHKKRYRYVREFFADDELVAVYSINDTEIGIGKYPTGWEGWLKEFHRIVAENKTEGNLVWYVGDQTYYDGLTDRGYSAILVDRTENPISGTLIRENPIKNWDKITKPFRRIFSHNILITGTASEGKSTLVKDLGKYFNAPSSYEWAIGYMNESCVSEWELDITDFLAFLEGQYNLNRNLINSDSNHGLFFSDTDSLVTNMYSNFYSKDPDLALTEEEYKKIKTVAYEYAKKSRWNKIFLLAPHGVFVDNHIRYMNHSDIKKRKALFDILVESIKEVGDWDKVTILNGNYYENFISVVNYVKGVQDGQN